MTPEHVINLVQNALLILILIASPLLAVSLGVGLLVSVFQAATQINEMTLTFIPKLLAMFLTVILAGPWMLFLTTTVVLALTWRREFASHSRAIMLRAMGMTSIGKGNVPSMGTSLLSSAMQTKVLAS